MLSTFGSLQTALRTLHAMQQSIQVSNHNIANAATPGYSRQKATLVTGTPYSVPASNRSVSFGQVGTGVIAGKIQRFRSSFLDSQIRSESLAFNGWETRRDLLQQIEVIFQEPSDTGLNNRIDAFWSSWRNLSDTPNSMAARGHVAETADDLSATIRATYHQLKDLQTEFNDNVAIQVSQINNIARRIADLNKTIRGVQGVGQQPNDLRDQRDQLLAELAGFVKIDAHENENGSVLVSLGGKLLVMDHVVSEIKAEPDPTNQMFHRIAWSDTGATVKVTGIPLEGGLSSTDAENLQGKLGSLLVGRDLILSEKMAQLDDIANTLIGAVNTLHQTGFGLSGNSGGSLTSTNTIPGTINGFSLVPPKPGMNSLNDNTYYVEIRDNANTLEFRLVDASSNPITIDDASLSGSETTNGWQPLNLVAGTVFDTGRGLAIDFAPIADHSLGAMNVNSNVSGFSLSGVSQAAPELPGETYYVEMRDNGGNWQFRLVDSSGGAVETYDLSMDNGSLTNEWQSVPSSTNIFDTSRGLTIQFSGGPYTEAIRGGSPTPPPIPAASVGYTARGTQVGEIGTGAASVSFGNFFSGVGATDIAVSNYIKADYSRIATAGSADSPGDGSIALAIGRLKDALLLNGNSTTINDFFRTAIAQLGQDTQQAEVMADSQDMLIKHLESRQSELAGVSLDEETVNLIEYQRAYQAAARVMTTLDEMLEKIINGMGLVGR